MIFKKSLILQTIQDTKKQEHLTETLIDAKIDDLNTFLSSHPVEDKILHLTAKDLEKTKYKFLASSVMRKNNPTLAGDLESLLPELLKKYKVVKWDASKENPANKRYKEFTDKYGGEIKPYTEKDEDTGLEEDMIQYVIESKRDSD